ncbi:uncharacterized protein [Amphiura filiformis]|uniref:uncharacterized protein n=1 Tax=Amphiura filiformis TaxID=82378 RepID=UPI003B2235C1
MGERNQAAPPRLNFVKGDVVRVTANMESFKYLQQNLDLWAEGMEKFCGQKGCIIDDSQVKDGISYPMVYFQDETCAVNPDCLEKVNPNDNSYNESSSTSQQFGQRGPDVAQLSEKQLRQIASQIPAHQLGWLATNLGISDAKLSHIYSDHSRTEERIYQVLLMWRKRLNRQEQGMALNVLLAALKEPDDMMYLPGTGARPITPNVQKPLLALPSTSGSPDYTDSTAVDTRRHLKTIEGDIEQKGKLLSESELYERGKKHMKKGEEVPQSVAKQAVPAMTSGDSLAADTSTPHTKSDDDKPQDAKDKSSTSKPAKDYKTFKKRDRVRVKKLSNEEMKRLQKDHGGLNPLMSMTCGRLGKVRKVDSDGDIHVKTDDGPSYYYNPECLVHVSEDEEKDIADDQSAMFKKGDRVLIKDVPEEEMKKYQKESGGWNNLMTEIRGKPCIVSKIQLSSIVVTMLTGDIWAIHPLMLTKDGVDSVSFEMEHHFRKGDKVKVKLMEIEEMKKLQKGNGGWSSQLATHMNKTGVIVSIQKGRVCIVKMDNGERTAFYRACLTLVEPAAKKESSDDSSDSSDDSSDDDERGKKHMKKGEEVPQSVAKQAVPAMTSGDSLAADTSTPHTKSDDDKPQDAKDKSSTSKPAKDDKTFKKRDRVRVKKLSNEEMKRLQKDHGGLNPLMSMCLVHVSEDEEKDIADDQSAMFKKGDRVLIKDVPEEEMKKYQKRVVDGIT